MNSSPESVSKFSRSRLVSEQSNRLSLKADDDENGRYFLQTYHQTNLQNFIVGGASVVPTSKIRIDAMFVLLMAGNLKLKM
jgi:hypothetical protein